MNKHKKRKTQRRKEQKANKKSPTRACVSQDHPKGAAIGQIKQVLLQQNNAQNNKRGLREARKENQTHQHN